jgi:hypothetical protein
VDVQGAPPGQVAGGEVLGEISTVRFLLAGLPVAGPVAVAGLYGISGHFGWTVPAAILGLPWNLPALAIAIVSVLSNSAVLGPWTIQLCIVWSIIAMTVNSSLIVLGIRSAALRNAGKQGR